MRIIWVAPLFALAAVAAHAEEPVPLLVQAEGQTLTPFCAGLDLQVEGNHNVIKPFGVCRSLLLKGVANEVVLDVAPGAPIRVEGGTNHVAYRAPAAPVVTVLGTDSVVVAQAAPPEETGPDLQLAGEDQARAVDCAGRAVTVQGERSLYVLRGGCKSLTLHGDLIMVQAEMQPNAAIAINGHGSRVGWVMEESGRRPTASIHGEASHIERLEAVEVGPAP